MKPNTSKVKKQTGLDFIGNRRVAIASLPLSINNQPRMHNLDSAARDITALHHLQVHAHAHLSRPAAARGSHSLLYS